MPPRRPGRRRPLHSVFICSILLCIATLAAAEEPPDVDVLDLSPQTTTQWTPKYVVAPVVSLFRGRSYMYSQRRVKIDTTPSGGYVDLFYVRSGFQKRYEQAEAPVTILLPSRLETGPRDTVTIRAFAEGYRQQTVTFRARDPLDEVVLDLEPLPNHLEDVRNRYFAARSSISFLTSESLTFRLQDAEDGVGVILTETAISDRARDAVEGLRSPLVVEGYSQQLGEDLLVRIVLSPIGLGDRTEIRSRQSYNAPREVHQFDLDLVPADGGAAAVERAHRALQHLSVEDVRGCAIAFDTSLRGGLPAAALARALAPQGSFVDPYIRAAMRRLGEVSVDGVVDFEDGARYRPGVPIELEMSLNQASEARGFLALLRRFVDEFEEDAAARIDAFRGLVAPEMAHSEFIALVGLAEAAEGECRGGR